MCVTFVFSSSFFVQHTFGHFGDVINIEVDESMLEQRRQRIFDQLQGHNTIKDVVVLELLHAPFNMNPK